jgi:hypothetical protein
VFTTNAGQSAIGACPATVPALARGVQAGGRERARVGEQTRTARCAWRARLGLPLARQQALRRVVTTDVIPWYTSVLV